MNNFKLGMLAAGSLLVAACSSDKTPEPVQSETRSIAVYNPATGQLPLPNDLLFSGTTDFTLNVPVADPNDFSDPLNAISALDGWSTVAPISISVFNEDANVSVNPASLIAGNTIRVFEIMADTRATVPNLLQGITPTFAPTGFIGEVPATNYVAVPSGSNIAIVPTRPLAPEATYLVVLTNGVTDTQGLALEPDGIYQVVSSETVDTTNNALVGLQRLVRGYENLAAAGGVDKDSIILTFAFTTQSVGKVLESAKAFYVDKDISVFDPTGSTPGLPQTPQYPATSFSSLFTDTMPFTGLGAAQLYKGELTLDYLLETPDVNPLGPITGFWKAAAMVPNPSNPLEMIPNPLPGEMVTYINSLPEKITDETVPLFVGMPKAAFCPKPASGYPVVIFQHGITGNRTQMLGMVDGLAGPGSCRAVVAMDLPLHGIAADNAIHLGLQAASGGLVSVFEGYTDEQVRERTFGVDYVNNDSSAPGPDGAIDSSGTHFINFPSLLTSRDNLRQAVLDLLTLKSAIPAMDVDGDGNPDFDANEVDFIGMSLGGIVGSTFAAMSGDTPFAFNPALNMSPQIDTASLVVPGGGIAGLLSASQTFGPVVQAGVAAGAGIATSDPRFPAILQQFLFAAQTVIDSADPINTAGVAVSNNVPTFMIRVEGDAVVPNNSPTAPLSGTDPLAALLGVTAVDSMAGLMLGDRLISRFNTGLHSTYLTPNDNQDPPQPTFLPVTVEMQTQVGSFIASDGTAVLVTNNDLID